MNGAIPMIQGIVTGNHQSSTVGAKPSASGFGSILAQLQQTPMQPGLQNNTQEEPTLNMEEEILYFLSELAMNTVESGEKLFEETSESISDVIQGLIEQLQIINEQDREKVQEMVLQMNQFLQQPALLENMSLLNDAQLKQLTDIEQVTDNPETKPVFAAMYVFLKGLGQMLPNAQELLKQYQQTENRKEMPSFVELENLVKKIEAKLQEAQMRIEESAKLSRTHSLLLVNGGTMITNRFIQMGAAQQPIPNDRMVETAESGQLTTSLPMSKVEQFVLHLGTTNGKSVSANLQQDFEQILAKSSFTQNANHAKLTIRLAPEHLGSLTIELIKQDQVMVAKMMASTQQAKEMLESQMTLLKQALINANIQVEKIDIQQQLTSPDRSWSQSNQQQEQSQEHADGNEQHKENKDNEETSNFLASLQEELINLNI